jgi:inner membrane protein
VDAEHSCGIGRQLVAVYRDGHLGAALLAYVPVGLALAAVDALAVAALGAALAVAMSMVPDYDQRVPGLSHRGVTHTLGFALAFGVAVGVATGAVGTEAGVSVEGSTVVYGVRVAALSSFGFLLGTLTTLSHLAADALTPAGVPLLWPLSDRRFSLDLVTADSTLANYLLLVAGVGASLTWAWPLLVA